MGTICVQTFRLPTVFIICMLHMLMMWNCGLQNVQSAYVYKLLFVSVSKFNVFPTSAKEFVFSSAVVSYLEVMFSLAVVS